MISTSSIAFGVWLAIMVTQHDTYGEDVKGAAFQTQKECEEQADIWEKEWLEKRRTVIGWTTWIMCRSPTELGFWVSSGRSLSFRGEKE